MELADKNVLLTGGAHGIGRCLVDRLLSDGANVGVFDLDAEGLQELQRDGPGVYPAGWACGTGGGCGGGCGSTSPTPTIERVPGRGGRTPRRLKETPHHAPPIEGTQAADTLAAVCYQRGWGA